MRDCFLADLEINLPFILYLFILGIYVKWVVLGMVKRLGERKRVREWEWGRRRVCSWER